MAAEVWFYHLERSSLEVVLPELLEKSLAKGWRALVRSPARERLAQLDQALWAYRDDSFLPHGRADMADAAQQPILLTSDTGNPNDASLLVLIDRAGRDAFETFERTVLIFDGLDTQALEVARADWKELKEAGHKLVYWQQGPNGWVKKAEA